MTSLAALFYLTALYAFLTGRKAEQSGVRFRAYCVCALSALCAMLSKENAILLPYAILLYEVLFFRPLNRKTLGTALLIALGVTVLLLMLSFLYTDPMKLFAPYTNRPFTMVERLLTQPRVLFIYLAMLAVPMTSSLSILHDVDISTSLITPRSTLVSILGLMAMLCSICLLARRHRLFAFCGLFFFLNHALESSFLNLELIYEHRNYLPSTFLFVPLGVGIVRAMAIFYYRPALRYMIVGCAGLILMTRMQTTHEYNRLFANEYDLWRHVTLIYPKCSLAYNNIGKVYWSVGDFEKSYHHVLKAVELDNFRNLQQEGMAYYNLGLYAANIEGDYGKALERFEKARALFGDMSKIWHEVIRVCMQLSDFGAADRVLAEALEQIGRAHV
jgi:tetratricopeptide (TPR) repeat protein